MKIRQGWGKQKRNIEPGSSSHLLTVPILVELIFRCHFPRHTSTCGNAATFGCETRRLFNGLTRNDTDVFHSKQKSNTPGDRQRDLRQGKLVIWSFSVLLPSCGCREATGVDPSRTLWEDRWETQSQKLLASVCPRPLHFLTVEDPAGRPCSGVLLLFFKERIWGGPPAEWCRFQG